MGPTPRDYLGPLGIDFPVLFLFHAGNRVLDTPVERIVRGAYKPRCLFVTSSYFTQTSSDQSLHPYVSSEHLFHTDVCSREHTCSFLPFFGRDGRISLKMTDCPCATTFGTTWTGRTRNLMGLPRSFLLMPDLSGIESNKNKLPRDLGSKYSEATLAFLFKNSAAFLSC